MKKTITFILLLFLFVSAKAQTSICGVDFGANYYEAEKILESKFGTKKYDSSDENTMTFINKMYAGFYWNYLKFSFQGNGNNRYFNRCILLNYYKSSKEAIKFREELVESMREEFENIIEGSAEDGFKSYSGGEDPYDPNAYGFRIGVFKLNDSGVYCSGVWYGPYNIVKE